MGFTELYVFNDETLLALCFLSFVFFAYTFLADSFFNVFNEQYKKNENDAFVAFSSKYQSIRLCADTLIISKTIFAGLLLLEQYSYVYNTSVFNLTSISRASHVYEKTVSMLQDILLVEQLTEGYIQILNAQTVTYPFIFEFFVSSEHAVLQIVNSSRIN
jgi:hypothetical protein